MKLQCSPQRSTGLEVLVFSFFLMVPITVVPMALMLNLPASSTGTAPCMPCVPRDAGAERSITKFRVCYQAIERDPVGAGPLVL